MSRCLIAWAPWLVRTVRQTELELPLVEKKQKIWKYGEKQMPLVKTLVTGVIAGVVVGIACFFIFELVGAEVSPAVVGGVSGGVVGGVVPVLLSRKSK